MSRLSYHQLSINSNPTSSNHRRIISQTSIICIQIIIIWTTILFSMIDCFPANNAEQQASQQQPVSLVLSSVSDHRPRPYFFKALNSGQNDKKSLLNDEGLRFKKLMFNNAGNSAGAAGNNAAYLYYGHPLLFTKKYALMDDEGMRFKKPALLDDEGMRFKKDTLLNDEGMRFKKDTLLNDEGMRFKKDSLFNDEGMRFKKGDLIDDEGMRFKKSGLIDDEGMRFKRLLFSPMADGGTFRFKKNPDNELIDKNLIIRKSVLDGEGLRFKKGSLLDREGMRFKRSIADSIGNEKTGKLIKNFPRPHPHPHPQSQPQLPNPRPHSSLQAIHPSDILDVLPVEYLDLVDDLVDDDSLLLNSRSYERRSGRSGNQDILNGEGMRFKRSI